MKAHIIKNQSKIPEKISIAGLNVPCIANTATLADSECPLPWPVFERFEIERFKVHGTYGTWVEDLYILVMGLFSKPRKGICCRKTWIKRKFLNLKEFVLTSRRNLGRVPGRVLAFFDEEKQELTVYFGEDFEEILELTDKQTLINDKFKNNSSAKEEFKKIVDNIDLSNLIKYFWSYEEQRYIKYKPPTFTEMLTSFAASFKVKC